MLRLSPMLLLSLMPRLSLMLLLSLMLRLSLMQLSEPDAKAEPECYG